MSVWTTGSTGIDTVLATLGTTITNQSQQQTHQQRQKHLLQLPSKAHSAHHLNFSGSLTGGSSPSHSHNNSPLYPAQHNSTINQFSPSNYHSTNHLFTPNINHTQNSFVWSKSGSGAYQQKVNYFIAFDCLPVFSYFSSSFNVSEIYYIVHRLLTENDCYWGHVLCRMLTSEWTVNFSGTIS